MIDRLIANSTKSWYDGSAVDKPIGCKATHKPRLYRYVTDTPICDRHTYILLTYLYTTDIPIYYVTNIPITNKPICDVTDIPICHRNTCYGHTNMSRIYLSWTYQLGVHIPIGGRPTYLYATLLPLCRGYTCRA